MPADSQPSITSRATLVNTPGRYRPDIDRWAVIVGISEYQHSSLNLRWAHRDAEELYNLLLTPAGGSFATDHVQLLVNQAATTQAVSRALRSFLKKPAREDVVLIYFACHGGPDPDRPDNLYLLTHDTDPDDIAGTALPMREIDLSLKDNLLAERVVILADTCHSAGIGGGIGRRSVSAEAGVVNAYLAAMRATRGGLALLTSAEASETSQEDARWGDGHGVFTYYLLEGLRGAADGFSQPRDGKVAVGELFDYVRQQVQQATGNSQHPAIGSNPFDRELPLAITGGIGAQGHLDLGRCLYALARIADEPDRYRAAARQFEEALRLSSLAGAPLPEAGWRLAQAWLAAGEKAQALDVLARLTERSGDALPPPARFTLALAQAVQGDSAAAATGLEEYLERYPGDAHAPWGRYCQAVLKQPVVPRALLIGIGRHAPGEYQRWHFAGPANDVALIKDVLTKVYGFADSDVVVLMDEQATWQAVDQALQELAQRAQPDDPIVVYYTGMGFVKSKKRDADSQEKGAAPERRLLMTYDGLKATAPELDERLRAIPAVAKVLIADSTPCQETIDLAEQAADYSLLLAAKPGQQAQERSIGQKEDGTDRYHGVFTFALAQAMQALADETAAIKTLFDRAKQWVVERRSDDQTPVLAGKRDQSAFRSSADQLFQRLMTTEQWVSGGETVEGVTKAYERFLALQIGPYAQAHLSFGRAFMAHGALEQAIAALATAVSQGEDDHQAVLVLGTAQVAARQYSAARATFDRLRVEPSSPLAQPIRDLRSQGQDLTSPRRHALVVGIDRYADPAIAPLAGAVNDARAMRDALVQWLGFQPENIVLLLDEDASRERVLMEFRSLAAMAETEGALFYFAGYGSFEIEEIEIEEIEIEREAYALPTLALYDSRSEAPDLRLAELAAIAHKANHLVVIADAAQESSYEVRMGYLRRSRRRDATIGKGGARELEARYATAPGTPRDIGSLGDHYISSGERPTIGHVSMFAQGAGELPVPALLTDGQETRTHGVMTWGLLRALEVSDPTPLNYRAWLEAAGQQVAGLVTWEPLLIGAADEPLFDRWSERAALLATAARIELNAVYQAIELLRRQIGERSQQGAIHPDGWVSLGVAYGVLGDYSRALEALEAAAAATTPAKAEMAQSVAHDVSPEEIAPQISYHLGRLLLASQQDYSRAVSELRSATRKDPNNGRAFYYLGRAIREMVQRETLAEVEDAFSAYLNFGAPVGHRSEVVEFLRQRAASQTETPVR